MIATYNYWIVALSFVVALFAAYRAIGLAEDLATCSDDAANSRILSGAVTLGTGIWGMHFIGMLALHLPIPLFYDPVLTMLSGLFAILAAGFALWQIRNLSHHRLPLLGIAIVMGTGIAIMHYVGMAAMRMQPAIEYDPWLFGLSILIAIGASFAAIRVMIALPKYRNHPKSGWFQLGSALLLATGIAGMHYTGMAAALFRPGSICLADPGSLTPNWLLVLVAITALLAVILSHFAAPYAKRSVLSIKAERSLPILVFLVLAALSLATWIGEKEDAKEQIWNEFNHQVERHVDAIEHQFSEHEEALYDMAALFAASKEVEPDEFRTFADKLSIQTRYHGIQTMGFLRPRGSIQGASYDPARESTLNCYSASLRVRDADMAPIFRAKNTVESLQPLAWSQALQQGLAIALIAEKPTLFRLPGPVSGGLATSGSPVNAIVVYPVFHNGKPHHTPALRCSNLLGWVYAGLNLNAMLQTIHTSALIRLDLYEGNEALENARIWSFYGATRPNNAVNPAADYTVTKQLRASNANWIVKVSQSTSTTPDRYGWSMLIPILGMASAIFMAMLVLLLNQARTRAFEAANKVELELEEKEKLVNFITEQNLQLEHTAQLKTQFLATMSHELRTPLNSILGFSEILAEAQKGPLNEAQQQMLHHIQTSGQHLLSLVNDTLDLAKIDAGRMPLHLEGGDAYGLIADSLASVQGQAEIRHMTLLLKADKGLGLIWTDIRKLRQVIYNLLSNAIKFSPTGSCITLQAKRVDRALIGHFNDGRPSLYFAFDRGLSETFLEICIEDQGIGIAEKDFPKLFQPFSQVDSKTSRQFGGTGLGLALTKSLVEHLGGGIALQSAERQGSCFTVWVPWIAEAPAPKDDKPQ